MFDCWCLPVCLFVCIRAGDGVPAFVCASVFFSRLFVFKGVLSFVCECACLLLCLLGIWVGVCLFVCWGLCMSTCL